MGYYDEIFYDQYPQYRWITNPIAISLFSINLVYCLYNIQLTWYFPIDLILALYTADFVVGMGHMLTDRMCVAEEHHVIPANMLKKNFWSRNAENTVIAMIFSLVFQCNFMYIAAIIGSYNGDLHYWQHNYQHIPWHINLMWKSGIFVDYKYHKLHHVNHTGSQAGDGLGTHNDHYTTVTAWSEPLINWIDRTLTKYDILNIRDRSLTKL